MLEVRVLPSCAGDAGKVTVGSGSNLQDGTVVRTHETRLGADVMPGPHPDTVIGNHVTIGHHVRSSTVYTTMSSAALPNNTRYADAKQSPTKSQG